MHRSMRSRSVALISGATLLFAVLAASVPTAPASAQGASEATARELVIEAWTTAHGAEIYAELRRSLKTAWIPASNDHISGKVIMPLIRTPQTIAFYVELNHFLKILDKAGDELDGTLAAHREEFMSDLARLISKHFTVEEIVAIRGALRLSATRKGLDAAYTISRILTDITYEDVHANQLFVSFWQGLVLKYAARLGTPDATTPATTDRVIKATTIVNDFLTSARVDDMIADGLRFTREVILPTLDSREQQRLQRDIHEFERQYTIQRPTVQIFATTGLATVLNDAELDELQAHMRGPGIAKLYKAVFAAERAITSLTLTDTVIAKTYFIGWGHNHRTWTSERRDAFRNDLMAFKDKWLAKAVSPATREAFERSVVEFERISRQPGFFLIDKPL